MNEVGEGQDAQAGTDLGQLGGMDLSAMDYESCDGDLLNFTDEFKFADDEIYRETDQWEVIKCTADSGAVDNVGPEHIGKMFDIKESPASRERRQSMQQRAEINRGSWQR